MRGYSTHRVRFAGVHVKGQSLVWLEAAVRERLADEGLAPDDNGARRVVLLEGPGWVTLADEDCADDEHAAGWAGWLSAKADAPVVMIAAGEAGRGRVGLWRAGAR